MDKKAIRSASRYDPGANQYVNTLHIDSVTYLDVGFYYCTVLIPEGAPRFIFTNGLDEEEVNDNMLTSDSICCCYRLTAFLSIRSLENRGKL